MSGYMDLRLDQSDFNSATVHMNSRSDDGSQRTGATVRLNYGDTIRMRMPEFLQEEDEEKNEESKDLKIDRLEKRIHELEELERNQLVASDDTDQFRIKRMQDQLNERNKESALLNELLKHVEGDFSNNINNLDEEELAELEEKHGLPQEGGHEARVQSLQKTFEDATIEGKVEMIKQSRALSNEKDKEGVRSHRAPSSEIEQEKASLEGRTLPASGSYAGSDSTTDKSDVDTSAKDEDHEEPEANTSPTPLAGEDQSTATQNDTGATGGHRGGIAGTTEPAASEESDEESKEESDEETNADIDATEGAKELADEEGVDLHEVEGSGKDGRITKDDVKDHLSKDEE